MILALGAALILLQGDAELAALPVAPEPPTRVVDFLVKRVPATAQAYRSADGRELLLDNGLVRRTFLVAENLACTSLLELRHGAEVLRAVRPEARLTLNGKDYPVGGLTGQPNHAWLSPEWIDSLSAEPSAFVFESFQVSEPEERLAWKRVRHAAPDAVWPPAGVHLQLNFGAPTVATELAGVRVEVHYELYDQVPVFSKWLRVVNGSGAELELDSLTAEILAVVEYENPVETRAGVALEPPSSLHVETDFAFGGFTHENANRHVVHWEPDPEYTTQVNYLLQSPCLLEVRPDHGPDALLAPGQSFDSFRVFELVHDSDERERRGLALRRMYRTVAPWVTENPIILHVVSSEPDVVKNAIDQAATTGFEMVSLSFGSGLNMEDTSAANLTKFRDLATHAEQQSIELGGYSLLSSRRIQPDDQNCIHPDTGQPGGGTHGFCPSLSSPWGQAYFASLRTFFEETGFRQFTHDGSYPGDLDAAERPPLQRGLEDSAWVQWRIITDFYKDLRAQGAYVRVPDYYFLSGSNECGMGYRETNWSLPRAQQILHTRQNIFDGTWEKTPSMGWMFVPLTQYHGGGAAATIEPLDEHLGHYKRMLFANMGFGVQAVYRGTRAYDTKRVSSALSHWIEIYKKHRDILESDLIHGRRADGRDLDWMLHVNPFLPDAKGLLIVWNPLQERRIKTLRIPLYYTGLGTKASLTSAMGVVKEFELDRAYEVEVPVTIPPDEMAWFVIRGE